MNWLDHSRTFREQGVDENETLLLRRKFFYSDQNVDSRDPVQLNLLYVQVWNLLLNMSSSHFFISAVHDCWSSSLPVSKTDTRIRVSLLSWVKQDVSRRCAVKSIFLLSPNGDRQLQNVHTAGFFWSIKNYASLENRHSGKWSHKLDVYS